MSQSRAALQHYAAVQVQSSALDASPHRLTAMLFDGALERIARAKGHLQRGELACKGELISSVVAIGELSGSLRRDAAPELVDRLAALYDYILGCLIKANASNRAELLDEASQLLGTLAEAWQSISPQRGAVLAANG